MNSEITLLDGGMGKELRRIGAPFRQPEWSALALMEAPELVVQAHNNFIEAGAQMIITNNYAVVPYHLGDDMIRDSGAELTALAGPSPNELPTHLRATFMSPGRCRRCSRRMSPTSSMPFGRLRCIG